MIYKAEIQLSLILKSLFNKKLIQMAAGGSLVLYSICSFAAIGGLCFGYDTGVISSVLTMSDFQITMTGTAYLSSLQQGTITGLLLAGCFIGSLIAGKYAKYA